MKRAELSDAEIGAGRKFSIEQGGNTYPPLGAHMDLSILKEYDEKCTVIGRTVYFRQASIDWHDDAVFALATAQQWLEQDGIVFGEAYFNLPLVAQLIMMAECCNYAAKVINDDYYSLKPRFIELAVREGAFSWINYDERGEWVCYLYHRDVGTASFHDPYNEIAEPLLKESVRFIERPYEWSQIPRQDEIFEMLRDVQLLRKMAFYTRPRRLPRRWTDLELILEDIYEKLD